MRENPHVANIFGVESTLWGIVEAHSIAMLLDKYLKGKNSGSVGRIRDIGLVGLHLQ